MLRHPVRFLRMVALAEAVSYLLLLGVAMPLKYFAGMPMAVMVVGSIHGGLFVVFGIALARAAGLGRWPLLRIALVFVASLLPLVPFFLDARMRRWATDAGEPDSAPTD